MMWRSSVVLPGLAVAEHHQQRVLGEVEKHRRQVLFALADDDLVGAPIERPSTSGARLVGSNRTRGAATPGWRALIAATGSVPVQLGAANRKCSAAMVNPRPGWSCGRLRPAGAGADHTHIAVPRVVQPELEAQAQAVAHRQRYLQPARGGDDHVDAIRQADVDELGTLASKGLRVLNWSVLSRPNA